MIHSATSRRENLFEMEEEKEGEEEKEEGKRTKYIIGWSGFAISNISDKREQHYISAQWDWRKLGCTEISRGWTKGKRLYRDSSLAFCLRVWANALVMSMGNLWIIYSYLIVFNCTAHLVFSVVWAESFSFNFS